MNRSFNRCSGLALVIGLCLAGNAFATNGYFTHGNGTKNKSMAGAGIALPEDAIDVTNNPAVATEVGDQFIFGAALFSPIRKYRTTESFANGACQQPMGPCAITIGPNDLKSDENYFVIPHLAWSKQLDNGNAFALSFYGRGGMNTTWKGGTATFDPDGPAPGEDPTTFYGTYGAGDAGVDYNQAFLDITWAKKVNDRFSFGITGVLVAHWFEATGVASFAPLTQTCARSLNPQTGQCEMPTNLSNNGHDWAFGYGFKVGIHYALSERVTFGAMYQSNIWMDEFDDYADLFAEQGDMDVPPDLKVGLTWQATDTMAWSFDIEHAWYSEVDSVGNSIALLFACPTALAGGMELENCLGGNNGGGFGWEDMTTYKLGLRYTAGEDWTWRLGYSYGEQPIPVSEMSFNILAPGVMEHHLTAGFTLERTKGRQFNMAFMYAPNVDQTGPQNFDPSQTVTFEMYQWEIEASYSWRF
jgi:long-chain fatty acid transport protein